MTYRGPGFQYCLLAAYLVHFRGPLLAARTPAALDLFFAAPRAAPVQQVRAHLLAWQLAETRSTCARTARGAEHTCAPPTQAPNPTQPPARKQLLRRALKLQQAAPDHAVLAPAEARLLPRGQPCYPDFTGGAGAMHVCARARLSDLTWTAASSPQEATSTPHPHAAADYPTAPVEAAAAERARIEEAEAAIARRREVRVS